VNRPLCCGATGSKFESVFDVDIGGRRGERGLLSERSEPDGERTGGPLGTPAELCTEAAETEAAEEGIAWSSESARSLDTEQ